METKTDKNELKSRIYGYYVKGLTYKEIAKLLDVSEKTVQRIAKAGNFKELATPATRKEKVAKLRNKGLSYEEIAKALQCSRTTVYYDLRALDMVKTLNN